MADRITVKHLRAVAARINRIMGTPEEAYTQGEDGKYRANIGNFHISSEYSGYSLHQIQNEGGGVRSVFGLGHVPALTLYDQMQAYIRGLEDGRDLARKG